MDRHGFRTNFTDRELEFDENDVISAKISVTSARVRKFISNYVFDGQVMFSSENIFNCIRLIHLIVLYTRERKA